MASCRKRLYATLRVCVLLTFVTAACEEDAREAPTGGGASEDGSFPDGGDAMSDTSTPRSDAANDAEVPLDSSRLPDADASVGVDGSVDADVVGPTGDASPVMSSNGCEPELGVGSFELNLGITGGVLGSTSDRLLTYESSAWTLWNATTRTPIASKQGDCGIDCGSPAVQGLQALRGNLLLMMSRVDGTPRLELYNATTGELLGWREESSAFGGVANDGSYAFMVGSSLRIYSPSAVLLHTIARTPFAFNALEATPEKLYTRSDATSQIQSFDITTGAVATTGYAGTFVAWFADGSGRFLTSAAGALRSYSANGVQERFAALPTGETPTGGWGTYYWTRSAAGTTVRRLADDVVVLSVAGAPTEARDGLLLLERPSGARGYVDFRGATPASGDYPAYVLPNGAVPGATTLLAGGDVHITSQPSGAAYVLSFDDGALRGLSCGGIVDGELSANGHWAIATGTGEIRTGNLQTGQANPVFPAAGATRLELAEDGAHLLAITLSTSGLNKTVSKVDLYALSTGTLLRSLSVDTTFKLARFIQAGRQLGVIRCGAPSGCDVSTEQLGGTATGNWQVTSPMSPAWVALSPSGNRAAFFANSGSQIYGGGVLIGASAQVVPFVWLNEDQLNTLQLGVSGGGSAIYSQGRIVDATGAELSRTNRPYDDYYLRSSSAKVDVLPNGTRIVVRERKGRVIDAATAAVFYGSHLVDVVAANDDHALTAQDGILRYVTYP